MKRDVKKDYSKTEFLFESDAEKVALKEALKPRKPKLYKIIIPNVIILIILVAGAFFALYRYEEIKISKVNASVIAANQKNDTNERINSSSKNLQTINKDDLSKYEIVINSANPLTEEELKNYVIVNVKDNLIPDVKLEKKTYKNYLELKDNLEKRGYYINITNGYKSFEEYETIYYIYSLDKGEKYAKSHIAKAGTSEHNAGIAFDFIISKDKYAFESNKKSEEYTYLENIAYLYGFILRYPKEKEDITGFEYEPYHLRYVGKDLAKYLKKNSLTLEEYYGTES